MLHLITISGHGDLLIIPLHGVFLNLYLRYSIMRLWSRREEQTNWRVRRKADNRLGTVQPVMCDVGQLVLSSLRKKELHSGLVAASKYLMDTSLRKWSCTIPRGEQGNTEGDEVQQGKFQLRAEKKVQHDQMVAQISQRDCEISTLRDYSEVVWIWPWGAWSDFEFSCVLRNDWTR